MSCARCYKWLLKKCKKSTKTTSSVIGARALVIRFVMKTSPTCIYLSCSDSQGLHNLRVRAFYFETEVPNWLLCGQLTHLPCTHAVATLLHSCHWVNLAIKMELQVAGCAFNPNLCNQSQSQAMNTIHRDSCQMHLIGKKI